MTDGLSGKTMGGILAVLLALAAGGLYLGLARGPAGGADDGDAGDAATASSKAGSLAIPADVVPFPTLDGDTASLADYEGRVVVLNLWGTWCPPCRREIPHLVELQRQIEPRGGTVVGLAVDSGEPDEIRAFAEEFGMNYPIWMTRTKKAVDHYEVMGFPTTLIIDGEGIIRERYLGPQTEETLLADLEPFLEG